MLHAVSMKYFTPIWFVAVLCIRIRAGVELFHDRIVYAVGERQTKKFYLKSQVN